MKSAITVESMSDDAVWFCAHCARNSSRTEKIVEDDPMLSKMQNMWMSKIIMFCSRWFPSLRARACTTMTIPRKRARVRTYAQHWRRPRRIGNYAYYIHICAQHYERFFLSHRVWRQFNGVVVVHDGKITHYDQIDYDEDRLRARRWNVLSY